ncbi:MAG: APC family permease [Leadbetterella sp.]
MSEFKREIRLFDAIMLVSGSMIGSGIFVVSADVARLTGSTGYLLLAWIIAGLLTMAGALSYGELTGLFPQAGGQYLYLQKAYGRLTGFLYGWSYFLVIQTGTIAAVAVAFAKYSGVLFPEYISDKIIFWRLGESSFYLSSQRLLAILSIALLTWNNTKGVKQGKVLQNIFSSTKLIALALLIVIGFGWGYNSDVVSQNFSNLWAAEKIQKSETGEWTIEVLGFMGILIALGLSQVGTLFSSDAWNGLAAAGDEVVKPEKTIPRGLALGTLVVTVLYLLINIVYLCVLPLKGNPEGNSITELGMQFCAEDRVAAAVASAIGGNTFALLVAILIMISTFGCNNGLILSGSRVYYAMAKDGLFFKNFGTLNANNVPGKALWWQCFWAGILCLSGRYGDLLDFIMGVVILFYILTVLSIFILRKNMPDAPRPVKAPLYPFLPAIYIITASLLIGILLVYKPEYTYPGLGIVALGIPVYFIFNSKKQA